jgi:citrate synthase
MSMTAAEAADRLGVKQATLYAYVSRGMLTRHRAGDGKSSLFDTAEVERLARKGRPRRPAGVLDIQVETQLTQITRDQLRFRGHDATRLARSRPFEDVAELLWTGDLPSGTVMAWQASPAALAAGRAAQAALPPGALPLERLQVILPAMAATDPLRLQFAPAAVTAAARSMIAGMVECLPAADALVADTQPAADEAAAPAGLVAMDTQPAADVPVTSEAPLAQRLWERLTGQRPSAAMMRAMSAAMVLTVDHELTSSTLAARAAASVLADPYAVVATGLGAMSGALHGGASLTAEAMLAAASMPEDVPGVVTALLRGGSKIPGFGHFVYKAGDPRAELLLDLVRAAAPKSRRLAVAEAVLAEVRRRPLPGPNIDFALATLTQVAGLRRGSGEAIFAVARSAGLIAHAMEAYATGIPIRPRAVYTGVTSR